MKYATQLSCNFQHGHCTFVTILIRPFARLFVNLAVCMRALFTECASLSCLVEHALWGMSLFTRWIGTRTFEDVPCTTEEIFSRTDFGLQDFLDPAGFITSCGAEGSGEGAGGGVGIARLLPSCQKLHLSPFERCPLAFHCQHSPCLL